MSALSFAVQQFSRTPDLGMEELRSHLLEVKAAGNL